MKNLPDKRKLNDTGFISLSKKKSQIHSNALGAAIFYRNYDIAEYIVENLSMNVNQTYEEFTDTDPIKPLAKEKIEFSKMTPLLYVAWIGDDFIDLFKLLLEKGADPLAWDGLGNNILHFIA